MDNSRPKGTRVAMAGSLAAALMAAASIPGAMVIPASSLPKRAAPRPPRVHRPHQGKKECAKRIKQMERERARVAARPAG